MRTPADHTLLVLDHKHNEYISEELNNQSIDLCKITRIIANKTQEEQKTSEYQNNYPALEGRQVYKDPWRDRIKR
jgi:hypothetical protein